MAYNINFQALALWIGLAAVVGGGYFVVSSGSSSQQTSFNIGVEEDTVPGELTRLSVENNGEPVQGANISIDGEFIGTTNSQGIKGFETPENNFTVEASKGDISSETTFIVEDGSFSSPDDSEGSDGDGEDEDSSDGSDSDDEDSSDGSDNDSEDSDNQDSNQDSSEDDQQDSSDTVDDFTGIELDEEPMIGELRTLTVYDTGEKVSGAEVTVNGEIVGTTNAGGTVTFGVPNAAEVSVSTDTGLSETFTVQDYTEDDQNQTDDQNDTEEDLTTGMELDSNPVSGTTNRIILYDEGDRVSGETVYLDGNELGQTGSNGAIEFEVPLKEQITVTTDYGLGSQTFNVTENHPEPEITLLNPTDTASFDTPTGTNRDVTFEASVDITESSGTASLMIDGSEAYTQDLSSGANSISTTQALSGGTHNWQIDVDTPEYDVSSSSRSLTINEVEVQNGLSLQNNATEGEFNYVRLYDNGDPVEGKEITVNSDSIGNTDSNGEVGFEVPNTQEITVSASGYSDITRTVDGYEEIDPMKIKAISPKGGDTVDNYRYGFEWSVEAQNQQDFDVELFIDGKSRFNDSVTGYSKGYKEDLIVGDSGEHTWQIKVQQDGNSYTSEKLGFDTTEDIPISSSINAPTEGVSLPNYYALLELDYFSGVNSTLDVSLDGKRLFRKEYPYGTDESFNKNITLKKGDHRIKAEMIVPNVKSYIKSVEFSTTESMPIFEVDFGGYGLVSSDSVEYSIRPFERMTYESILVDKQSGEETVLREFDSSEFEGFNINYPMEIQTINQYDEASVSEGKEYGFYISAKSKEREKEANSSEFSFTP